MRRPKQEETVNLIEVDILSRTFAMHGDKGSTQEILCDTIDQFMNVLEMVRDNEDRTEVVYVSGF